MFAAAALLVSTSLPAEAFVKTAADAPLTLPADGVQRLSVSGEVVSPVDKRDAYTVQLKHVDLAQSSQDPSHRYTNNINGTIQWPFPDPVPVSSGFGARQVENCSFCSTNHQGVDFVPPAGTVIDSIAAGIVTVADKTGPFGNHVMIEHVIGGRKVQTLYAHMIAGSIVVAVGQTVTVAQPLGQVGSTGNATGPHLHFEVHLAGVPVDPFAWLKANAN